MRPIETTRREPNGLDIPPEVPPELHLLPDWYSMIRWL